MTEIFSRLGDVAWPTAILLAWIVGELGYRRVKLPRISAYGIVGFALASSQSGFLPPTESSTMLLLANIAFGLILFEAGYRINLAWLRANRWMGVTSLSETALAFILVCGVLHWFDLPVATILMMAALSMATSPAAVVRVINEQGSSGQVTERVLHLSVLNCTLAVLAFKIIVGLSIFKTSGNLWQATYSSLFVLSVSVLLGAIMGVFIPSLLRAVKRTTLDSTLVFATAVIFLVTLTHSLKLSPVLAALTFGLAARHRRIVLNPSQRGFGALGDLFSVLLFVFISATLEWRQVVAGFGIGLSIILARQIAKIVGIGAFAHISGISWHKGLLTGVGMAPLSAFVILVLEQTRHLGISLVDQVAPLAAAALMLEILGPICTQRALIWSHEVPEHKEA
jgi:Kef-type K+ transport system membrane component KefB